MLEEYKVFNKKKFLEDFKRKFNNVIKKSPILAKVEVIEPDVSIFVESYDNNPIKYTFDYNLNVKLNIYNIRKMLKEKVFPIIEIESIIEESFTSEEVEELIFKEGYNVDEALSSVKQIKEIAPDVPVVIQTASVMGDAYDDISKSDCDDTIFKPINYENLIEVIDRQFMKKTK